MSIDAVKIPQNVYVEDRIIGPVSLRQIIIVLIGAGVSYGIWSMLQAAGSNIVLNVLAWSPCALSAIFAFVKVNGISLFRLVLLWIERLDKPAVRRWQARRGISINIKTVAPKAEEEKKKTKTENTRESQIQELSAFLDAGPQDLEDEEIDGYENTIESSASSASSESSPKPVNPSRVQVDPIEGQPVDTIQETKKEVVSSDAPEKTQIMRDISPAT